MIKNVVEIANVFIKNGIKRGDVCVDMTMGNGNDTLFLARQVGSEGKVFAFDVQDEAIKNTDKLLKENNIENVILIHGNHSKVKEYIKENIKAAVFNLGYLPGGDKQIVTDRKDVLSALSDVLELLEVGGFVSICSYLGHDGGKEEYTAIKMYLSALDKAKFDIIHIAHFLRKDTSPRLIIIEKKGK